MSKESDELSNFSFETIEENESNVAWFSLIQNLSYEKLETLKDNFKEKNEDGIEFGLSKDEFLDTICRIYGNVKYGVQCNLLFDDIAQNVKDKITWNDFLDFLIENLNPKESLPVKLTVSDISEVSHSKKETVVKVVLIESQKYFCYAIVSKYGRVGLYDGNLNFLTSYHTIMTKEDLDRDDSERRRRNRWVTDAVYCSDVQMFIVVNSTRSLIVYEASGLNHVPCWLIIGMPNVVNEIELQKEYVQIGSFDSRHYDEVKQITYCSRHNALISCSTDPSASVIIQYMAPNRKPYIFKMRKGCSCFAYSSSLKLLLSGSTDGTIRIWNPVIVSKATASIQGHEVGVVDLQILENQRLFLSFDKNAVLKVWNLDEHKCFQVIEVRFPCFQILGKSIEFGVNSIYPGPKRNTRGLTIPYFNKTSTLFSLDDVEEMSEDRTETNGTNINVWERSHVLVTCCSYVAKINLSFEDVHIESTFELSIFPPPPLQNSVLVPSSWNFQDKEGIAFDTSDGVDDPDFNIEEKMKELEFVLNKDFLGTFGTKSDINSKIAILESKKMQMKQPVEQGAAYLALDLYDLEELSLSKDLPIPDRETKRLFESTEQSIKDAIYKDQVFSDLSSSRSRSSDTSLEAECQ
nr:unnamed protein product [Callosobruchus chinensis]